MQITIVGAGASGLALAIKLKQNNPNIDVLILDKNNKAGRKLLATGNGRCNIGNNYIEEWTYNDTNLTNLIFEKYNFNYQNSFWNNLGIKTKMIGDLCYPYSESSKAFVDFLFEKCNELGVDFAFEENIIDYKIEGNKIRIITNKQTFTSDKLVFATGGKSYQKLGSDGSVFDILKKHNYDICDLKPGLCPIICKEKTKDISGQRIKSIVTLKSNNDTIHKEQGEVLFKDNGLSGIVIFNISSLIARKNLQNVTVSLDLLPEYSTKTLFNEFKEKKVDTFLKAFFALPLVNYINNRLGNNKSLENAIYLCKNLVFTYKANYDFDNAQITIGGINSNNFMDNLESKIEKNIYFVGEIIDNDGLCGGFNLMWAFGSGFYLGDLLCK